MSIHHATQFSMSMKTQSKARLSVPTAIATLRLLNSMNSRPHGVRSNVDEREVALGGDGVASCFEPRQRPRKTLVLVHGVTGRAHRDPLLVHLARSLAEMGYRCIAPALTHLARFRHDPRDIETVIQAVEVASRGGVHHEQPAAPAILAFSYGASYALCAAADPRVADRCSALVGFGAYYDLREALEHQYQLLVRSPGPEHDDADLTYLRYTLLACYRDRIGLTERAWQALEPILVNFTAPDALERKRAPLLRHARDVDYVSLMRDYTDRSHPPSLSPASSLSSVKCWVGLLHDPDDRFVPKRHAEQIRAILDARPRALPTSVLCTRMLSHVQVDPLRRVMDLPGLMRVLNPVLSN